MGLQFLVMMGMQASNMVMLLITWDWAPQIALKKKKKQNPKPLIVSRLNFFLTHFYPASSTLSELQLTTVGHIYA